MLPLKLKIAIAKIISSRVSGAAISVLTKDKIRQFGCVYSTDFKEIPPQTKASLFYGLYEKAEASFVREYLSGKYPAIELGGSLGIISCVIGKKLDGKKFIVVEANKLLLSIIKENLRLNDIQNVEVEWGAIGDLVKLYFHAGNNNTTGTISDKYTMGSELVSGITIEYLLKKYGLSDFSLISDIEGSENFFLFKEIISLNTCREIIIELHETIFHNRLVSVEEQVLQIKKLQFRILDRHGCVIYARKNS